jgi:UDP-glucose 4-epimerase
MHFSAFAYVGESTVQPARYYRNNVTATLNLLAIMREFKVDRFIFSSSCTVYGDPIHTPIDESHTRWPVSPYGRTKFMVEEMLKELDRAYGFRHVNLRYFNAAGADPEGEIGERHDPETHLIPLAIFAAQGVNEEIRIFGRDYPTRDGTCIRDYIHVNDLAEAHIIALEYLAANGKSDSFNLGNGSGYSVNEVIDGVRELSGKDFKVTVAGRRSGDPAELVSDSRKAARVLGWAPRYTDLSSILATAWDWHSRETAAKPSPGI